MCTLLIMGRLLPHGRHKRSPEGLPNSEIESPINPKNCQVLHQSVHFRCLLIAADELMFYMAKSETTIVVKRKNGALFHAMQPCLAVKLSMDLKRID